MTRPEYNEDWLGVTWTARDLISLVSDLFSIGSAMLIGYASWTWYWDRLRYQTEFSERQMKMVRAIGRITDAAPGHRINQVALRNEVVRGGAGLTDAEVDSVLDTLAKLRFVSTKDGTARAILDPVSKKTKLRVYLGDAN